jgi:hypothetical protein
MEQINWERDMLHSFTTDIGYTGELWSMSWLGVNAADTFYYAVKMTPIFHMDRAGSHARCKIKIEIKRRREQNIREEYYMNEIPKDVFEKYQLWGVLTPVEIVAWKKAMNEKTL